jgi:hypothetical protein
MSQICRMKTEIKYIGVVLAIQNWVIKKPCNDGGGDRIPWQYGVRPDKMEHNDVVLQIGVGTWMI